jgi:NADH dehydrogenase
MIITGATGYIGRALVIAAARRGFRVLAATRGPPADGTPWIRYELAEDLRADAFPRGATLVHLASATASKSSEANAAIDIAAAERLLAIARERELDVVFVSSVAARRDAPTAYGRAKLQIESRVLQSGGRVVRPGLVYGGAPGGVFAELLGLVRRMPIVPVLAPAPRVQPVHVDDLATAIVSVVLRVEHVPTAFNIGAAAPVPFTRFLRVLAAARLRRRRLWLPVPAALATGATAFGRGLARERLRSLLDLPTVETERDMATLGVALRPLVSGMHPSGDDRRQCLSREARSFLRYVLGVAPPASLIRRYVRWLEATRPSAIALALPAIVHRWPVTVSLIDRRDRAGDPPCGELDARLDAAVAIAEASPVGAQRFLRTPRGGRAGATVALAGAIAAEATARVAGAVLSPWLRRGSRAARWP